MRHEASVIVKTHDHSFWVDSLAVGAIDPVWSVERSEDSIGCAQIAVTQKVCVKIGPRNRLGLVDGCLGEKRVSPDLCVDCARRIERRGGAAPGPHEAVTDEVRVIVSSRDDSRRSHDLRLSAFAGASACAGDIECGEGSGGQ